MITETDKANFIDLFISKSSAKNINCWVDMMRLEYSLLASRYDVLAWLCARKYIVFDNYNDEYARSDESISINYEFSDYFTTSTSKHNCKLYRSVLITPLGILALTPKIVEHFHNKKMEELKNL